MIIVLGLISWMKKVLLSMIIFAVSIYTSAMIVLFGLSSCKPLFVVQVRKFIGGSVKEFDQSRLLFLVT